VRKSSLEKLDEDEEDVDDVLVALVVLVEERALMLMADLDRCPSSFSEAGVSWRRRVVWRR
jgi:hypothetical protein